MDSRNFDDTFKNKLENLSEHPFQPKGWEEVQQQLNLAKGLDGGAAVDKTNWKTIALITSVLLLCTQFVILSMFWLQKEELQSVRNELKQIKEYQFTTYLRDTLYQTRSNPNTLRNKETSITSKSTESISSRQPYLPSQKTYLPVYSSLNFFKEEDTNLKSSSLASLLQKSSSHIFHPVYPNSQDDSLSLKLETQKELQEQSSTPFINSDKQGVLSRIPRLKFERVSTRLNLHLSQGFYQNSYGRLNSSPAPLITILFSSPDHPYVLSMGVRGIQKSFFSDDISKTELSEGQINSFPSVLNYGHLEDLHEIHSSFSGIDFPLLIGINSRLNYKSFLRTEVGTSLTRYINNTYEYDFFGSGDDHEMFVHNQPAYWDWGGLEIRTHVVNRYKKNLWFEYGLGGQLFAKPQGPEGRNYKSIHLSLGMGFGK